MSEPRKRQKIVDESNHLSTANQVAHEVSWLLMNKNNQITRERFLKVFPNQTEDKELCSMDRKNAMSKMLTMSTEDVRQAYYSLHKDTGMHEDTSFLGVHTLVPRLLSAPDIFLNTILRSNSGRLPPYSICMGDKRRVRFGAKLFDSGTATVFERVMLSNGQDCGRVEIATGLYKGTPIVLFEHQMGCPAVEIIMRELLSDECMTQKFILADHVFLSDAKYIIRVGTCAGINHATTPSDETIDIYDILVASHQAGVSSTDVQSMSGNLNPCDPQYASTSRKILEKYGYKFDENHWPIREVEQKISNMLVQEARKNIGADGNVHLTGNVSKDSLYSESTEEMFTNMRKEQNVGSTEMEFSTIMKVCRQLSVEKGISCRAAMILVAVGVLPGSSFGSDHIKGSQRTKAAMMAAMEVFHSISQGHRHNRGSLANL